MMTCDTLTPSGVPTFEWLSISTHATTVAMNASYTVDPCILITTAHVQAALETIPDIVQPKEVWQLWMQDNLAYNVVSNLTYLPHSAK